MVDPEIADDESRRKGRVGKSDGNTPPGGQIICRAEISLFTKHPPDSGKEIVKELEGKGRKTYK